MSRSRAILVSLGVAAALSIVQGCSWAPRGVLAGLQPDVTETQ